MIRSEKLAYDGPSGVLEGVYAWDDAVAAPRPGVFIVHSALGPSVYEAEVAADLARAGYPALAADLYGKGAVVGAPEQAVELAKSMLRQPGEIEARMAAGLEALRRQPAVDAGRTAAIGYCLGGKAVLDLARRGGEGVAGVVSFHGGLIPAAEPAIRPMTTKVLILHGWDDPYAPPEHVAAIAQELTEIGADWQIHIYGRAGHAFGNKHRPHVAPGIDFQPDAARRSWKSLLDFLGELFPAE
jgi:dienelactone hydrolase